MIGPSTYRFPHPLPFLSALQCKSYTMQNVRGSAAFNRVRDHKQSRDSLMEMGDWVSVMCNYYIILYKKFKHHGRSWNSCPGTWRGGKGTNDKATGVSVNK